MSQPQVNDRVPVWRTQFVRRERARAESMSSESSLPSSQLEEAEAQAHQPLTENTFDPFHRKVSRTSSTHETPPAQDNVEGQLHRPDDFVAWQLPSIS